MVTYGIIGYPLSHSFSPGYFNSKFEKEGIEAVYKAFPLETISGFKDLLLHNTSLAGLSVTIPYKESIMRYLDDIDIVAKTVGAVNCIAVTNGRTKGFNTDIIGFERSLVPLSSLQHTHALVLGNGGAAGAVKYVLDKLGIIYLIVSRTPASGQLSYEQLTEEMIRDHTLIINTTPLGMYPNVYGFPALPYSAISKSHLLYDLVYNPAETLFIKKGKDKGAITKNGQEMLELQAEAAWEIWNSK